MSCAVCFEIYLMKIGGRIRCKSIKVEETMKKTATQTHVPKSNKSDFNQIKTSHTTNSDQVMALMLRFFASSTMSTAFYTLFTLASEIVTSTPRQYDLYLSDASRKKRFIAYFPWISLSHVKADIGRHRRIKRRTCDQAAFLVKSSSHN